METATASVNSPFLFFLFLIFFSLYFLGVVEGLVKLSNWSITFPLISFQTNNVNSHFQTYDDYKLVKIIENLPYKNKQ